jgi:polyisoprenoid-binding protein YceI
MATEIWHVDPTHSDITFTLRHLIVTEISGHVRRWQGTLRIDPQHPTRSSVDAVLDARSIDTEEVERDEHIGSAEFLNVKAFPEIRFRSTSVTHIEANRYRVVGNLTVRDVVREVTLDMEALGRDRTEKGGQTISFRAQATINRQDFGLHWNQDLDTGGIVLGDKVDIQVAVQAVLDERAARPGVDWLAHPGR